MRFSRGERRQHRNGRTTDLLFRLHCTTVQYSSAATAQEEVGGGKRVGWVHWQPSRQQTNRQNRQTDGGRKRGRVRREGKGLLSALFGTMAWQRGRWIRMVPFFQECGKGGRGLFNFCAADAPLIIGAARVLEGHPSPCSAMPPQPIPDVPLFEKTERGRRRIKGSLFPSSFSRQTLSLFPFPLSHLLSHCLSLLCL